LVKEWHFFEGGWAIQRNAILWFQFHNWMDFSIRKR
jgi:hypothetical protein